MRTAGSWNGGWVGLALLGFSAWAQGAQSSEPLRQAFSRGSDAGQTAPLMLDQPVANPAEAAQQRPPESRPSDLGIVHPWELPPVNVVGERPAELREEQRVGTYGQPLWTTDRRFAEERVYVNPEGSVEFETWFIPTVNRRGASDFLNQNELEFGLPGRIQLDLYLNRRWEGAGGPTFTDGAVELRYALADWGRIWGNPTLYFEYAKQDQQPDVIEARILLGGQIAPRWHWGTNLNFERETGQQMTNQYEVTGGVSYTVLDSRFDAGAELKFNETDTHAHRGRFTDDLFIGPSIQFRLLARAHIDVVPLIGITHETPALQLFIVFGWEL